MQKPQTNLYTIKQNKNLSVGHSKQSAPRIRPREQDVKRRETVESLEGEPSMAKY